MRLVALSGPTPRRGSGHRPATTIVSASKDMEAAAYVQEVFTNNVMRVYTNEDIKVVELSGAMKNVIALASASPPASATAIMPVLPHHPRHREIARLGVAMGCNVHTFAGLAASATSS